MRCLLLAAAALAAFVPYQAQGEDWLTKCRSLSNLAEMAMLGRQKGVKMADMMEAAQRPEVDIAERIIIDAYDQPRFSGEKARQDEVTNFTNRWYRYCLEAERPDG